MRILVCGNAPSLARALKDKDLSPFDKVVRVNCWRPIPGYDNRCDAWAFYALHHITSSEPRYDLRDYAHIQELWVPHEFTAEKAEEILGRKPDYILTDAAKEPLTKTPGLAVPTTGTLTLYMAQLIEGATVYAAGFDFYQSKGSMYYYGEEPGIWAAPRHGVHNFQAESAWYKKQIEKGTVREYH